MLVVLCLSNSLAESSILYTHEVAIMMMRCHRQFWPNECRDYHCALFLRLHSVRILQFHLKSAPFIFSLPMPATPLVLLSIHPFGIVFCVTHSIYLCDGVNSCCDVRAHTYIVKFPTGIEALYERYLSEIHRSSGISISELITSRIAADTYHNEIKTVSLFIRMNGIAHTFLSDFCAVAQIHQSHFYRCQLERLKNRLYVR